MISSARHFKVLFKLSRDIRSYIQSELLPMRLSIHRKSSPVWLMSYMLKQCHNLFISYWSKGDYLFSNCIRCLLTNIGYVAVISFVFSWYYRFSSSNIFCLFGNHNLIFHQYAIVSLWSLMLTFSFEFALDSAIRYALDTTEHTVQLSLMLLYITAETVVSTTTIHLLKYHSFVQSLVRIYRKMCLELFI